MLPPDPRWCARIHAHRDAPPEPAPSQPAPAPPDALDEACEICGSPRTEWRKCKLVCLDCRQIVKSCADL
ncbi:MAG TPA: hypothetical protein VHG28_03530 [Longimicrobiaceae bacterium]|nr:hypothetical protein [Longimicrobiaceae bacterium]